MIDVSDGLAADVGHLADASGVGVRLDVVPVAPGATRSEALSGGDDYALVFCAPSSAPVTACFAGLPAPILLGRCTAEPTERTLEGEPFPPAGWEHRW
jgi:thiamine-monophosphate kinase